MKVDFKVPKWMIPAEDPDKRPIRSIEKPVPLNSVRLVFPLTDPETGIKRDVIVKQIINGPVIFDRHTRTKRWSRFIAGVNVKVPWPAQPNKKEDVACAGDTLRIDVEEKTFVPTLLRPPMPGSVIDELRNKYSVFRTRHEPEYIAAKMKEDEEKAEKKKLMEQMITPLREANRLERKLKKAKGKGKLTDEMLEKIGKIIASKRQLSLDIAGMSKEDAAVPA
jgi:large subunit ribosomal protein L24